MIDDPHPDCIPAECRHVLQHIGDAQARHAEHIKRLQNRIEGNGREGMMQRLDKVEWQLDSVVAQLNRVVNLGWGLLAVGAVWFLGRATYLIIQMEGMAP